MSEQESDSNAATPTPPPPFHIEALLSSSSCSSKKKKREIEKSDGNEEEETKLRHTSATDHSPYFPYGISTTSVGFQAQTMWRYSTPPSTVLLTSTCMHTSPTLPFYQPQVHPYYPPPPYTSPRPHIITSHSPFYTFPHPHIITSHSPSYTSPHSHTITSHSPSRRRKVRTVFSSTQIVTLEENFKTQKYLAVPERIKLANSLGLTDQQIKTWFQNRRTKWKKDIAEQDRIERESEALEPSSLNKKGEPSTSANKS